MDRSRAVLFLVDRAVCKAYSTYSAVILLVDGHSSHYVPEGVRSAAEQGIIFCLPPHSTYVTQPLDVSFFQVYWSEACHIFMQHCCDLVPVLTTILKSLVKPQMVLSKLASILSILMLPQFHRTLPPGVNNPDEDSLSDCEEDPAMNNHGDGIGGENKMKDPADDPDNSMST